MDPNASPYNWVPFEIKGQPLAFMITNIILEPIVLAVTGLRFYSRVTTSTLGWDDWFVLAATIICIFTLATSICMNIVGSGYLLEETMVNLSTMLLLVFIIQPLFLFAIMCTKLSVCFFYLRIFVNRGMRIATFITMGLVVAWAVAHFLAAVFICKPVAGQYDLRLKPQTVCGDQAKFFQSGLSINVVLDAVVLVLPMYTIWNLNMRTSDKIGLTVAFSIGFGMTAIGIVRAIYVTTTALTGDITGTLPINQFLTVLEQQLAIIVVSIPMLRPLWSRYRKRVGGYSLEESEKAVGSDGYKGPSAGSSGFRGTGGKNSRGRRGLDDSLMETTFELRTVSNEVDIKGPDHEGRSMSGSNSGGEWDGDTGSQTRLGGAPSRPAVIDVKDEWEVSRH